MKTIQLTIPTMKSPHCQLTVTRLVEAAGASVKGISPAKLEIELGEASTRASVVAAIEKGGYPVQCEDACCAA